MIERHQISFVVPGVPVREPQFKVQFNGTQQMGIAQERKGGWVFFWICQFDAPAASAPTLWELVDAIIVEDNRRFHPAPDAETAPEPEPAVVKKVKRQPTKRRKTQNVEPSCRQVPECTCGCRDIHSPRYNRGAHG